MKFVDKEIDRGSSMKWLRGIRRRSDSHYATIRWSSFRVESVPVIGHGKSIFGPGDGPLKLRQAHLRKVGPQFESYQGDGFTVGNFVALAGGDRF